MKTHARHFIKRFGSVLLVLIVAPLWLAGCAGMLDQSDPPAGWKVDFRNQPDQAVVKDYRDYIQHQPSNVKDNVGPIGYLTDAAGRHAVDVEIFVPGKNALWHYFLIYDSNNKRVSVTKYGYARFQQG